MSRKTHASSRRPILSETESALKWELRRAQTELRNLRKTHRESAKEFNDRLPPEGIADLIRKIGTMVRNGLPAYYHDMPPCSHCGSRTMEQMEAAFQAWADAEANPVNKVYPPHD